MKKILFLLFAAAAFAACNDDDGAPKIRYASTNDGIVNGHLQGINMFFYGRAVATDDTGDAYTDDEALFEFAGGPSGDSEYFSLYMHKTRFAASMPPFEMKIPHTHYTGKGNSIAFSEESIVPEAILPGQDGYQPLPSYTLTEVEGTIDGVNCRVSFTCTVPKLEKTYRMEYEGKLIIKE
ncbi:hypothetical protein [Alistipes timonensis]|uniref:hypothetical protein n=1 Tax=Alistipes timonensis TaxID=1465754 RepID=UPI001896FE3F|nr:hypothetical protein [Alistipes timonensis]